MKTIILPLIFILLTYCNTNRESTSFESKFDQIITNESIGSLKIGSAFNSVDSLFTNSKIGQTGSEGYFWPIKTVTFENGKWLAIESQFDNKITSIETNSPKYKYKSIFHVGTTLNKLAEKNMEISIFSDVGGIDLILTGTNLTFKIEPEMEQKYFEHGGEFPETLDFNSRIYTIKLIK